MADFDTIARFMQLPLFHAVELGRCGLPMNLQQTTQIGMLCLFRLWESSPKCDSLKPFLEFAIALVKVGMALTISTGNGPWA
jgi:hypothetical protein